MSSWVTLDRSKRESLAVVMLPLSEKVIKAVPESEMVRSPVPEMLKSVLSAVELLTCRAPVIVVDSAIVAEPVTTRPLLAVKVSEK